ncbi:MAG: prolyl oligopeptidase family serine peptidase, partial [Planctomycetes bacterium]|nr:prolyl oligopeptidase family serine peptidase [Planctomycetota bacterium]
HGASVDAFGLAQCYQPKDEWWIATPTNRAPYGFDWQDWGRRDAYEVRDEVLAMFDLSSQKVCLTGHSMGGHGTWHLAVNDPDSWAGIAPSAGWSSFDSYTGRPEGSLRPLWHGADGASKTMDLLENLRDKPLYLLHGGQDDNVPTQEAIDLASALDELGLKYTMHIEPEAGHWWGNACVDWPGIFETFAGQSVESNPREVDFWSADPGVDAEHHWVRVEQPLEYGRATRVSARRSLDSKHAIISTENVRSVQVRLPLERAIVDGLKIGPIESGPHGVWFVRMPARVEGGEKVPAHWRTFPGGPSVDEKRPECSGPFKRAFDKEFVMVYGTAGTAEETATLLARARFDAGVWFYRANGHGRLCSDQEFLDPEHPEDFSGRNVVLYGNQDTNSAWDSVLDSNAMQVARGRIQWGDSFWEGDDLGAVYVRPRKGEHDTLVGVVASTGVSGARLGYTLSPFISGVGYPDFAVFDASVLTKGDEAILAAGWWNHSWGLGIPDPPREQR